MSFLAVNQCYTNHTNYYSNPSNKSFEYQSDVINCNTKNIDSFEQQSQDYKKNLEELNKNGGYIPEKKHIFGTNKAQYIYKASGRETLKDIKEKFNLKEGAIKRCNPYLKDDDHMPNKGTKIFFFEEDVKTD